ncbi:MAG: hypothetical protein ABFR65_11660 [Pseudomonadota bacterium]
MKGWLPLLILLMPLPAVGEVPEGYQSIAIAYGIPPALFYSVALTESEGPGIGRPWPWTANVAGKGLYFESRQALFDHLNGLLAQGETNFDVGPAQVNWRWNGKLFSSLWEATDPYINLETAAAMIQGYYLASGSFEKAIGQYHAPNHAGRAERYKSRVRERLALVLSGRR